ncbi:MAG: AAA family ATPase [Lachnospiraceae bacterium]|nr:AAA family ATPase [Lachnospiraceae bacterium]
MAAEGVLKQILKKARSAMMGGIPILYIKTDSDILIQKIVEEKESPLVVLLNGESSGKYYKRPLFERREEEQVQALKDHREPNVFPAEDCLNYVRDNYPTSRTMGAMTVPVIWTYKMWNQQEESRRKIYQELERYVLAHEDRNHENYMILQSSIVILYGSEVFLSPLLANYTEVIDVGYPDEEEIRSILLMETGADPKLTENKSYLSALCTNFMGFSEEEIVLTLQKIQATTSLEEADTVEKIIAERKAQKMEGGILEECEKDGDIGGMEGFKAWLMNQKQALKNSNDYKREVGTLPPKGVLLCGIPGCGKSEAAKFAARQLDLPLLKMDIGSLMDKYQGVSEQRMRDALKLAESMSPCVLFIDELEKGFSGAGGSDGDDGSGAFKRMFGYMLGWMQSNKKPCFLFATANNIGALPKEFFRSGRFDALYAVYLPTEEECVKIFQSSMMRARHTIAGAKRIQEDEVELFEPGCMDEKLLQRIIQKTLAADPNHPRIAIGSDIQKVVNVALRNLKGRGAITPRLWEEELIRAINESSLYGDGTENLDSIAVSYCRMLRKAFTPTADRVLFQNTDYHPEHLDAYSRLRQKNAAMMREDERKAWEKDLEENALLCCNRTFSSAYDQAVYQILKKRINDIAPMVEQQERNLMIRR